MMDGSHGDESANASCENKHVIEPKVKTFPSFFGSLFHMVLALIQWLPGSGDDQLYLSDMENNARVQEMDQKWQLS